MKRVIKRLNILLIICLGLMLLGMKKTNAADYSNYEQEITEYEYYDYDKEAIIYMEDSVLEKANFVQVVIYDYEDEAGNQIGESYKNISLNGLSYDQEELNEYAKTSKEIALKVKLRVPDDVEEAVWGMEKLVLEEINGYKYVNLEEIVEYTNTAYGTPYKEDIRMINFYGKGVVEQGDVIWSKEIELNYEDRQEILNLAISIDLCSENMNFYGYGDLVDKYDNSLNFGGMGYGSDVIFDKYYWFTNETFALESNIDYEVVLPKDTKLEETYYKVETNVYQGETIEIENFGTLYYCGNCLMYDTELVYVYKNSLDKLKKLNQATIYTLETATGFEMLQILDLKYKIGETFTSDEEYTDEIEQSMAVGISDFNVTIKGNCAATWGCWFGLVEYNMEDSIYMNLEKKLREKIVDSDDILNMEIFDIYKEGGDYKGELELTFDVGTEYNGKTYLIGHLKNGLTYEEFTGKVENGEITIKVDGLSPFMLALLEKEVQAPSEGNQGKEEIKEEAKDEEKGEVEEKDETKGEVKVEVEEKDKTTAPGEIPKAGIMTALIISIAFFAIITGVLYIKNKELRQI